MSHPRAIYEMDSHGNVFQPLTGELWVVRGAPIAAVREWIDHLNARAAVEAGEAVEVEVKVYESVGDEGSVLEWSGRRYPDGETVDIFGREEADDDEEPVCIARVTVPLPKETDNEA